jgi:hypothetical protein
MKPLTRSEEYLFSLCDSTATTVTAQRAAIKRSGLTGMTAKQVEKIQRENWNKTKKSNPGVPIFVLAARYSDCPDWERRTPRGTPAGEILYSSGLMYHVYNSIDWERLRKHQCGESVAFGARIREKTNDKTGWDRVVWRYADYGLVLSPCRKKVAVSTKEGEWKISPYWRGYFKANGRVFCDDQRYRSSFPTGYSVRLRDCLRILLNAGFKAYLTRQTPEQIATGSGERGRTGELVLVVDFGKHGFYHAFANRWIVRAVAAALKAREEEYEQKELDALLARDAANIHVCYADSIKAGNCPAGTEKFGEQHGLDRKRHYTAKELLEISNGSTRFVRAAVLTALRRERREMAQGFSVLADHR